MFDPGPCVYMEKIAVGPECRGVIDIRKSPSENIEAVAKAKGESVRDVTAVILDRDRHTDLIAEVRSTGARVRLIPDGDVAGAISTARVGSGRSEEHTSELQSLMRISYAVFCLKQKIPHP